jgi:hypothetical protein
MAFQVMVAMEARANESIGVAAVIDSLVYSNGKTRGERLGK